MANFLIGRQQILDRDLNTYAYEILFRGHDFNLQEANGATLATNQVITDALLEIGLNTIVGQHRAFINFTSQNILEKTPLNLPKERVVIEVLENVTVDLRIINHLREFSQQGYMIALDDFVLSRAWLPLLAFADIVKLDVLQTQKTDLYAMIEHLKKYRVKLLAEKVETPEEFEALKALGCEYFQGFFFSKPNVIEGKRLGINQTAAIRLLSVINKPEVELSEIAQVIAQDVSLSYKLLHYINSAFFSIPRKIESIQQALAYLGLNEIRRWVNVLTLSTLSDKPQALLQISLIRARMCEQLAQRIKASPEQFFLVGMLSNIDALLDMPIEEALAQLPLTSDISAAILRYEGMAGAALQCAINYERWELSNLSFAQFDPQDIGHIYLESINWAKDVLGAISE